MVCHDEEYWCSAGVIMGHPVSFSLDCLIAMLLIIAKEV